MHGRNRSEYKAMQRDPKTAAKLAKKAEQWYTLTDQILSGNNDSSAQILALTEKLLTVNPDPLYLWNQRRIYEHDLTWDGESHLTAVALRANPKAYGAWFHRKWCLVRLLGNDNDGKVHSILESELALTVQFLERDERNFHCWNFRRFVVSMLLQQQQQPNGSAMGEWNVLIRNDDDAQELHRLMGAQMVSPAADTAADTAARETTNNTTDWLQHEWDFTHQKIVQNFSNFSAFHYRSKLFDHVKDASLQSELELVENAMFTEPDDQTAWWYQSFLLSATVTKDDNTVKDLWRAHISNLQELRDEVPHSKWVVLGLLNCQRTLQDNKEDLLQLCDTLLELDPDRTGRYQSLRRQIETEQQ